jgi:hypothetical protein
VRGGRRRPLIGRELWRIGDWGGASMQIGRRWEQLGASHLPALLRQPDSAAGFAPRAALSFVGDSRLSASIQAAGLPNADAVLLGTVGPRLALRPVDFKWSLEVARPEQVSGETMRALLEAELPELLGALHAAIEPAAWGAELGSAPLADLGRVDLLDGLFLAPAHAENRQVVASREGLTDAQALPPLQARLVDIDGQAFFSPLPGWALAERLAAQEGARRALDTLEGAERYYRLGAGVLGALTARATSIFASAPAAIDGEAALAALRRAQRLPTTEQLIDYLDRAMTARSELVRTLNQLGRRCYPFAAFRTRLKRAGIQLGERAEAGPEDRRWTRLYGLVQRELSQRLQREGQALVAGGAADAQALATLNASCAALAQAAERLVGPLIEAERAADAAASG